MKQAAARPAWPWRLGLPLAFLLVFHQGTAWAQPPAGYAFPGQLQGPVFAQEPPPPTAPEFCPPSQGPSRVFAVPFFSRHTPDNAFVEFCGPDQPPFWYFGLGPIALFRQGLGNGVIAVRDPTGADNTTLPPPGQPVLVDYNNLYPQPNLGIRGQLGISNGGSAWEVSGFYVFNRQSSHVATVPSRLDLPFAAFDAPFPFNRFLWLQADQVTLDFENAAGSIEFNHRALVARNLEFLVGLRYFDYMENFSIRTEDNSISAPPGNPADIATYRVATHSHILGPQFGLAYETLLVPIVAIGADTKSTQGVNVNTVRHALERGDGVQGPGSNTTRVQYSSVYELNFYSILVLNEYIRIRAGYQLNWLLFVPEAHAQVNFDPNIANGTVNTTGSIFLHGPFLELQFKF